MTSGSRNQKTAWYLPQLDGLRFIAFLMVYMHHGYTMQLEPGSPGFLWDIRALHMVFQPGMALGVDLFFCLSAYLITQLLIFEHERMGAISLLKFYVRRALRIWPLFFFMVGVAFFILPFLPDNLNFMPRFEWTAYKASVKNHLVPMVFFLGNFSVMSHGHAGPFLGHLWTIAVEEQFYIFWPLLFLWIARMRKGLLGATAVAGLLLATSILTRAHYVQLKVSYVFVWLNTFARLDAFAVGIWIAFAAQHLPLSKVRAFWALPLAGALWLTFDPERTFTSMLEPASIWQYTTAATGLGLLLIVTLNGGVLSRLLAWRPLVYCGKISYGLYIYLYCGFKLYGRFIAPHLPRFSDTLLTLFHFTFPFLLTLGFSIVSYRLLETPFLRLKERFTIIRSRPIGRAADAET